MPPYLEQSVTVEGTSPSLGHKRLSTTETLASSVSFSSESESTSTSRERSLSDSTSDRASAAEARRRRRSRTQSMSQGSSGAADFFGTPPRNNQMKRSNTLTSTPETVASVLEVKELPEMRPPTHTVHSHKQVLPTSKEDLQPPAPPPKDTEAKVGCQCIIL